MAELISPYDARQILGVSDQTLNKYLKAGLIEGIKLPSGHRRYVKESVERIRRERITSTVTVIHVAPEGDDAA